MKNSKLAKMGAVVFTITAFAIGFQTYKYQKDLFELKANFRKEKATQTDIVGKTVEEKLRYVYQAIRTISFLPGVRKVALNRKDALNDDTKKTIQQIYNNAFLNIQLSEIYLVPPNLDPESKDPSIPKEPIITFDELIATNANTAEKAEDAKDSHLPEDETFEYALMKSQLITLKTKFPNNHSFTDFSVPSVTGPEVVTCDIAEFTKADLDSHNDEARNGIIFTVPIYDMAGRFHGAVSAIVRSNVFRRLIPETGFAITNHANSFEATLDRSEVRAHSKVYFNQQSENPDLIFSAVKKLNIADMTDWHLEVAFSNDLFWSSPSVTQSRQVFGLSLFVVLGIALGIFLQSYRQLRLVDKVEMKSRELLGRVESLATASNELSHISIKLLDSSKRQAATVQESASSMEEMGAMLTRTVELVHEGEKATEMGRQKTKIGFEVFSKLDDSLKDIEKSNEQLESINTTMNQVNAKTHVINDIVFETRLLSFNASIEAARAGVHGKGFAVVAEEVGKLASMSGTSAIEIQDVVGKSKIEVTKAVELTRSRITTSLDNANTFKNAFNEVHTVIESLEHSVQNISGAAREQSAAVSQTNKAMREFEKISTQNSSVSEDIRRKSDIMSEDVRSIRDSIRSLAALFGKNNNQAVGAVKRNSKHNDVSHNPANSDNRDHAA